MSQFRLQSRRCATARSFLYCFGSVLKSTPKSVVGGVCSEYCTFQPICRLERALGLDEETKDGE